MTDECLTDAACEPYTVSARNGSMTVGDTIGCQLSSATYSYKVTGDRLATTRVKDDCDQGDRPQWFNRATWRRRP